VQANGGSSTSPDIGEAGEGGEAGAPNGQGGLPAAGGSGAGASNGTSGSGTSVGGSSSMAAGGNSGANTAGGGGAGGSPVGGSTSGASAGGGAASTTCGNGMLDPGEACDASYGTPDGTCSNTCTKISNATCLACENQGDATCTDFIFNCLGPNGSFSAAQQTQCNTVLTCIQSSNCFDGTGTLGGSCYCGSLALADCQAASFDLTQAGAPNGPCAAVIQAGLPGVTSNSAVLGGLTASAKPAGAAMQLLNCQKTADGNACLGACGFTTGAGAFP
jgi:hypothetical protein